MKNRKELKNLREDLKHGIIKQKRMLGRIKKNLGIISLVYSYSCCLILYYFILKKFIQYYSSRSFLYSLSITVFFFKSVLFVFLKYKHK